MSTLAIVTMLIVLGILWGGFLICLSMALRRERQKPE